MLSKELLRKEISPRISRRLGLTMTVGLAAGLLLSLGVIALFAKIVEDVVEGESRRFDEAILLFIYYYTPDWLDGSLRLVTTLGYYWVVLPLLAAATLAFYRKGWKLSANLLVVSTLGGMVLTTALKTLLRRSRPELFDSGYDASFYSFPSGHATIAVGFYGALTLLLAWRLRGLRRWAVVTAGIAIVLLIGLSRLYLGVHYPTDVLAGFLAAPLWVSAVGISYFLWRTVRGLKEDCG
ncbi:MAG TPA: phosphatase PAP2 family protein [Rubrobacteraceae bacterium]|jgi:undecaprenyl-diphosphatase|nr:phosphatase PAP2 family protein [Rubrobacteraceae bacterium]